VPVLLPVGGPLDAEVAHLPFDYAGIATVPSLYVDFAGDFPKKELVVIFVIGEGEKIPVSISWTG
jgi:hypothetical protein